MPVKHLCKQMIKLLTVSFYKAKINTATKMAYALRHNELAINLDKHAYLMGFKILFPSYQSSTILKKQNV